MILLALSLSLAPAIAQSPETTPFDDPDFPGGRAVLQFETKSQGGLPVFYAQSVDAVGDVDGDGVPDFAVSAGIAASRQEQIEVYSGRTFQLLITLEGVDNAEAFVAGVGDLNADGLDDIAVTFDETGVGVVRIYAGGSGAPLLDLPAYGGPAPAGDLNADGVPDILVQPWSNWPGDNTKAFSGADGSLLFEVYGGEQYFIFTAAEETAPLGDVNGDGFDDVAIANPFESVTPHGSNVGVLRVYSGADGAELWSVAGAEPSSELGLALAAFPDQDGDGVQDVLHSYVNRSQQQRAPWRITCRSGASGAVLWEFEGYYTDLGAVSLSAIPDCDGDGVVDILVGRPTRHEKGQSYNYTQFGPGTVYVHSGATREVLHRFAPPADMRYRGVGTSVHGLGDLDGDGLGEILFSTANYSPYQWWRAGSAQVWSFEPFLALDTREVSASVGGSVRLRMDFPDDRANQPYKVLMSGRQGGITDWGVSIPLARDLLFDRTAAGVYPFGGAAKLHGVLDGQGDRTVDAVFAPGALAPFVGQTWELAAVVQPTGSAPVASSIARRLTVLP